MLCNLNSSMESFWSVVRQNRHFALGDDISMVDFFIDVVDRATSHGFASDKRLFPAIDLQRSGTRKEELLISKEDLARVWVMRRVLNPLSPVEQMEVVLERLEKTKSNAEFLASMQS